MPDILAANRLSLYELSQRFELERAEAAVLFPEWRTAAQAPVYARTKTLSIYDLEDLAQVLRLLRWLGWQRAGLLRENEA